ncbi:MAG TPA: precorrin-4 C(11)-methyltransferase [Chloroflexota bacterium]|nr:precorrin-4 C(11)-methyltransferase [Chloroflexota bacterium]
MSGKVYFIGAGPGDPELLTLKGRRLIGEADLVIYADSLVHPGICAFARRDAEVVGSSALTLEEVWERVLAACRAGQTVARVHSGDPSLYGAMHEQIVRLQAAGIPYEIVPGVSSAFAAAAALGAELTVPDVAQTVIFTRRPSRTTRPPNEDLRALAQHGVTLVIFLSVASMRAVVADLLAGGYAPDTPVAVVYRVTWEDERVLRGTLADIAAQVRAAKIAKQALILVGPAVEVALRRGATDRRSHLYSGDFSHLFRQARPAGAEARRARDAADMSLG